MMQQRYYSCGKLLITGEYLVLRGARGLALPTSRGQALEVSSGESGRLVWKSLDDSGSLWFSCEFDLSELEILSSSDTHVAERLKRILLACKELGSEILESPDGFSIETKLEFPRNWGLGSSSTLLNCIASWTKIDPYQLFQRSMAGSGYDVKVAELMIPLLFSIEEDKAVVQTVDFSPSYSDSLWFVHLGEKQDSEQEVLRFSELSVSNRDIDQISRLTEDVLESTELDEFVQSLKEHDFILSRILSRPSADEVFQDYDAGYCKYLGAWGGDFMMVTGDMSSLDYFRHRGYTTILSYDNMIRI